MARFDLGRWVLSTVYVVAQVGGVAAAASAQTAVDDLSQPTESQLAPSSAAASTVEARQNGAEADVRQFRSILGSLLENLRFTVDLSSRAGVSDAGDAAYQNVIGFDLHKVVSGARGDWGTVVLQGYLTRIDSQPKHPPFFDDADDLEFVYRIVNFNLTRYGRGRFNVRVGHFEIPFGLEHLINTNGTLRDFMHGPNLGLKADWGAGVNGSFPRFEYEVTVSRGTGNRFFAAGGPFVVAGRVGTLRNANVVVGVSAFQGHVWNPGATRQWGAGLDPLDSPVTPTFDDTVLDGVLARGLISRRRFGLDLQWYRGLFGLLVDAAYGQDYGPNGWGSQAVFNNLVEFNWTNVDGRVNAYVQSRLFTREAVARWNRSLTSVVGTRTPSRSTPSHV